MDQMKTPLFDAVNSYIERNAAYFRIPAHRAGKGVSARWRSIAGDEIFRYDLTEAPFLDDLHNPSGPIREAERLAADLFGADRSFFLVNGTTCGNEAMIIAAAQRGKKIAVPRNAHKSVLMGLIISGATPIYIMPEYSEQLGVFGCITPQSVEDAFNIHPDIAGVLIVSPNYYGLCSDLRGIAQVCHAHGAILMTDEAHGAHFYVSDVMPEGALAQNADMCAQSIHKTAGSLTQSSMLHVHSDRVDVGSVASALWIVQSTSPSYLLMTSLDLARYELAMHGGDMIAHAVMLAKRITEAIRAEMPGISCFTGEDLTGTAGVAAVDPTRLTISASALGISGYDLADRLFREYDVDTELADAQNIVAIVTYAHTAESIDRFRAALQQISADAQKIRAAISDMDHARAPALPKLPEMVMTPREAYFAARITVPWEAAAGRISAASIAPYPPGIPVVCPGEIIEKDVWNHIDALKKTGCNIHGFEDVEMTHIGVVK
jgi:arginine/lysine/ornithine decarboxylase